MKLWKIAQDAQMSNRIDTSVARVVEESTGFHVCGFIETAEAKAIVEAHNAVATEELLQSLDLAFTAAECVSTTAQYANLLEGRIHRLKNS